MDPIKPLQLAQLFQKPPAAASAAPAQAGFGDALRQALGAADQRQVEAQELALRFQSGDPGAGLEQTVLAMQSASVSFQAVLQTRNKLVQAYQEIMNMQV